jgi:hypothetical protein
MTSSLINSVEEVLRQGCILLNGITCELYAHDAASRSSGTIGAHYRHVLEHFVSILQGLPCARINYDERRRDARIENSVSYARSVTERLIGEFREVSIADLLQECVVINSVAYGHGEAEGVSSTVAREVIYSIGHAIHHYAIIKLLCAGMDVPLPYEFGVAPSTLKHAAIEAQG